MGLFDKFLKKDKAVENAGSSDESVKNHAESMKNSAGNVKSSARSVKSSAGSIESSVKNAGNDAERNVSEMAQSMIDQLGYPCKVFAAKTSYDEIMNAYEDSMKRGKEEGFTPVLVPVDDILDEYFGIMKEDEYSLEAMLKEEVDAAKGKEFLKRRFEEYFSDMEGDSETAMEEFIGVYEGAPDCIDSYSFLDYQPNEALETILFEVPTKNPWELVAYVPFGGWNDCPEVEQMLAVCKYWYQKYGAVPVAITHDVLEMSVPSPVAEQDALNLAKEHFAFTPDRVYQCTRTGTLSEVVECLKVSKIWYFWWD